VQAEANFFTKLSLRWRHLCTVSLNGINKATNMIIKILQGTLEQCSNYLVKLYSWVTEIQCVWKVTVHLAMVRYSTKIWSSVSKLPLKCSVVSLYSVVKQWLNCNTGKGLTPVHMLVDFIYNTFYKRTANFPNALNLSLNETQKRSYFETRFLN
jgi:hypothetical protein